MSNVNSVHNSDNFPHGFSGDLPGEKKYYCLYCDRKFYLDQMYVALNGDCVCEDCYGGLDEKDKERYE